MSKLTQRNIEILRIIVEEYIKTWELLWSKNLLKKYDLWVSPATIRNDMAILEELNLIHQPYNSSWRLPTSEWLRAFVNHLMTQMPDRFIAPSSAKLDCNNFDFIHNLTYELSKTTKEISFLVLPWKNILQYSGVANFLENNYKTMWDSIYSIIKILEDKNSFMQFILSLQISWLSAFIGNENVIHYLQDYTIIVKDINFWGEKWYIWIIWWLKMDYNFNLSVIKWIL